MKKLKNALPKSILFFCGSLMIVVAVELSDVTTPASEDIQATATAVDMTATLETDVQKTDGPWDIADAELVATLRETAEDVATPHSQIGLRNATTSDDDQGENTVTTAQSTTDTACDEAVPIARLLDANIGSNAQTTATAGYQFSPPTSTSALITANPEANVGIGVATANLDGIETHEALLMRRDGYGVVVTIT